ncbi:MAG: hypothetical protein IT367_12550 [Candidatus Hydrogenedentes bacterium]|nr:hypothetical protein [Candidatus Hydrogenedentota bacterium]
MKRLMGRKRKLITGWRLFFLAVLAVASLWFVEDRFVSSAAARAFYPADTYCMVSSWDFPKAWAAFHRSDVFQRMKKDWPRPYGGWELATRLSTGIRPDPNRWTLWMGRRTVFAYAPEGVGITSYPGHLTRIVDALRRVLRYGPDDKGIATYREYNYAWRDGYLIASKSRAYVEAALAETNAPLLHTDSDALFTVQWEGEHPGYINFQNGSGAPVSGQMEFTTSDGERALTLPQAWPSTPLLSLTARKPDDIAALLAAAEGLVKDSSAYPQFRARAVDSIASWGLNAPRAGWAEGSDHLSLAVMDINAEQALPLPDLAVALRYPDISPETSPFAEFTAGRETIPFEWSGNTGVLLPLLGTEWSPCVVRTQHDWIVTSREALMAKVSGNLAEGPACAADVDVALRASWEKLGTFAEQIVARLAEDEAIPRMNLNDARADLVPKITALSKLGEIQIDGAVRGGTLKISGHLAKPAEGSAP